MHRREAFEIKTRIYSYLNPKSEVWGPISYILNSKQRNLKEDAIMEKFIGTFIFQSSGLAAQRRQNMELLT